MGKQLKKYIPLCLLTVLFSACTPVIFGVPEAHWHTLTDAQKRAVIDAYYSRPDYYPAYHDESYYFGIYGYHDDHRHPTYRDTHHDKPRYNKPRHDKPRHDKPRHDKPRHEKPRRDPPQHEEPRREHEKPHGEHGKPREEHEKPRGEHDQPRHEHTPDPRPYFHHRKNERPLHREEGGRR